MAEEDKRHVKTVEIKAANEPRTVTKDKESVYPKTVDGLIISDYGTRPNRFLNVFKGVFVNNWQLKITAIISGIAIWGLAIFL